MGSTTNAGSVNPLKKAWSSTTIRSYLNIARDADQGEVTFGVNARGQKDPAAVGINTSLEELQASFNQLQEQQNNSDGKILALQQMALNHTQDMIDNFIAIDTNADGNLQSNEIVSWLQAGKPAAEEPEQAVDTAPASIANVSIDVNNLKLSDLLTLLSKASQIDANGDGSITADELAGFVDTEPEAAPVTETVDKPVTNKKKGGFFGQILKKSSSNNIR